MTREHIIAGIGHVMTKISLSSFIETIRNELTDPPMDWSPEFYFDQGSIMISFRIMI